MKHVSEMTVKELKTYCKKHEIRGYSKLRKVQILSLIEKKGNKKVNQKKIVIPQIPKRKAKQLYKIMYDFDNFCVENNLQYWVEGGTLMGALRHGGIIPWDDDVDVQMLMKDYLKLANMKDELKKHKLEIHYEKDYGNLMKISYINKKPLGKNKSWSFPFIDVFSMSLSRDKKYYQYSNKIWRELSGSKIKVSDVFPLKRVKFCGTKVYAPKNGVNYLKENYGKNVMKEAYFQGFHSGKYKKGEREMVGKYFNLKEFKPAQPCFYERKSRKRTSKKKSRRKVKSRKRTSKKKSRKPKTSRKIVQKSPQVLGSEIYGLDRQIKRLNEEIKERNTTQKGVQKQLDKDLKIKDPGIRIEQDIAYNEGLVQDIQKDIDKSEQQKKEIEHTLEIYRNISKKIKIKNKDMRTIQQLRYNISKIKNKELKKKLMDMLRTYKMTYL
jgi:lipopolysaccharide cholinephosphotransferase